MSVAGFRREPRSQHGFPSPSASISLWGTKPAIMLAQAEWSWGRGWGRENKRLENFLALGAFDLPQGKFLERRMGWLAVVREELG